MAAKKKRRVEEPVRIVPDLEDTYRIVPLDDPEEIYTNYDLGVTSALLCLGFRLLSVEKGNPRKALFVFKRDDGIEDFANQYFANTLELKARSFFDALKALKNRIYSD